MSISRYNWGVVSSNMGLILSDNFETGKKQRKLLLYNNIRNKKGFVKSQHMVYTAQRYTRYGISGNIDENAVAFASKET